MRLSLLRENYVVLKLNSNSTIPSWALQTSDGLMSITYTSDELSIVCTEERVPTNLECVEKTWRCLKVEGILDFSLTGILHKLTKPLAEHNISTFAISTFNISW